MVIITENAQPTKFVGYTQTEASTRILRYREVISKKKTHYEIVLNQTPFYAESGGQVGDTGLLISANEKIAVFNTLKENNLIIHLSAEIPENPEAEFLAVIDAEKNVY